MTARLSCQAATRRETPWWPPARSGYKKLFKIRFSGPAVLRRRRFFSNAWLRHGRTKGCPWADRKLTSFSEFESEMTEKSSRARKPVESGYSEHDIEVLEGLEPVRRRPGMYIGGTDEKAMHHLFAEVIDNSMDEAVAGHATWIEVELVGGRLPDRHRQRPRHPGRPASRNTKTRARSKS